MSHMAQKGHAADCLLGKECPQVLAEKERP